MPNLARIVENKKMSVQNMTDKWALGFLAAFEYFQFSPEKTCYVLIDREVDAPDGNVFGHIESHRLYDELDLFIEKYCAEQSNKEYKLVAACVSLPNLTDTYRDIEYDSMHPNLIDKEEVGFVAFRIIPT